MACAHHWRIGLALLIFAAFAAIGCGRQKVEQSPPQQAKPAGAPEIPSTQTPMSLPDTTCRPLSGSFGMSQQWNTGWIDLTTITNFQAGDRIRLKVAGAARRIVVRFLAQGASADSPAGVEGGIITVPPDGNVIVTLQQSYQTIKQISVHGGPNPWGIFPLGDGNGAVMLNSACLSRGLSPSHQ